MSYRIRPSARPQPDRNIGLRLGIIGAAVLLMLTGLAVQRAWTDKPAPEALGPISVQKVGENPVVTAWQLAMSPDGHTVAASSDNEVVLWDLDSKTVIEKFRGAEFGRIAALAFVSHGRGLGVGEPGHYTLFGTATQREIWSVAIGVSNYASSSTDVHVANFSNTSEFVLVHPAGMRIIEWDGKTDWQDGAVQPPFQSRYISTLSSRSVPEPVAIVVSPDNSIIAQVTTTKSVLLFNVASGGFLGELPASLNLSSVSFSDDSQLLATVAGNQYNQVILWDVAKREEVVNLKCPEYSCQSAVFRPGSRIVAVGGAQRLALWDFVTGTVVTDKAVSESITTMAFDPSGRYLVTGGEILSQWDLSP